MRASPAGPAESSVEWDNPLMLTIVGELVVKSLMLLYAGLVVTSGVHATLRQPRTPYEGPPTRRTGVNDER